jgi:hypothetical protein
VAHDLSAIQFQLESDHHAAHTVRIRLSAPAGRYRVRADDRDSGTIELARRHHAEFDVTMPAETRTLVVDVARLAAR